MKRIILFLMIACPLLISSQVNWAPIETSFPTNISGQINGLGRVCQIKFDPVNVQRIYAACVGGLFVTNDNGLTWNPTGTDSQLPPTQCASSCIDHTNNNTLYLGTGDPNYYSAGYGVWKSLDAGTTWTISNTGMGNKLVVEILMDPTNQNNIVAATQTGIYKSTNAGSSWTLVKSGGDFKNMVKQPGSNTIINAVTSSQVWRSTDFGTTWTQITNGVVIPGGGSGNGMRIAVSAVSPLTVYVGMIKDEGTILKSVDGGLTYTTVYHNPAQSLVGYDINGGGQGDYNFSMTCDPTDANTVYVVAHVVWKSTDGGVNWTQLTTWYDNLHTDMHQITFNPNNVSQLFNANDGGVWLNTNGGIDVDWHPRCNGLYCAEFYNAAQSDVRKDMVNGGLQDNGEEYFSGTSWKTNRGGDWDGRPSFSYLDDRTIYYNTGDRRDLIANGGDLSFNFPLSPTTPIEVMEFTPKKKNLMYAATNNVYRSMDINLASPTWTIISNINSTIKSMHSSLADTNILYVVSINNKIHRSDNALSASPTFTTYTTPISTGIAASVTGIKNKVNVVYLTCGSKVYRSINKGATWTNVSSNLPAVNISKIYHDHYTTNETVYVVNAQGVYYKDTTMTNWQNCSNGLPSISNISNLMIYNDSTANSAMDVFYYGRGIWRSPMINKNILFVDFNANYTNVCPGQAVTFTDLSIGSPTAWSWSFPGGTPSTSSSQNPIITYNTAGTYSVTLNATNSAGTVIKTKTTYITVSTIANLPIAEGFISTAFPPANWQITDDAADGVTWVRNSSVGALGSTSCAMFDNYNNSVLGTRDEIKTGNYNFSTITSPLLTFYIAYQTYGPTDSDTLVVLASTDCGVTFNPIYTKGGSMLASVPGNNTGFFTPSGSTQWAMHSVNLSAFAGQPEVMISFQNRNDYGQALYLDNINISGTTNINDQLLTNESLTVYPNPNEGVFQVSFDSDKKENYTLEILDQLGRVLRTEEITNPEGNYKKEINISNLSKGVYFIKLSNGNEKTVRKIITY